MNKRYLLALQILFILVAVAALLMPPAAAASAPVAGFVSNLSSGTAPLSVQFMDTSTNSPTGWIWSFGDGETSNAQNPVHTYTRTGTYSVTLAATNAQGSNTMTMNGLITVGRTVIVPVASFVSNATTGTVPVAIQFLDTSSNSPTSLVWSFGDGSTAVGSSPSHTYLVPGTYDVTLTASNAAGSHTLTRPGYIRATIPSEDVPSAGFVSTTTGGNIPLTVQFVDASTNFPVSWAWSFGDGETSSLQNPLHTYSRAGSFNVSLTATNAYGSHTLTRENYISVGSGIPVASFTASPLSGPAPLGVQFTDSSSNSPGAWNWAFGDGNVSSARNPVHVYAIPGVYTVSLSATNTAGTGTITRSSLITVTIRQPPGASFTSDLRTGTAPLTVRFFDTSSDSPNAWAWSFGDGAISANQNPSHTYMNPGSYTVRLVTSNSGGSNTSLAGDYIIVSGQPGGNPQTGVPELYVTAAKPYLSPSPASSDPSERFAGTAGSAAGSDSLLLPLLAGIALAVAAGFVVIWVLTRTPGFSRRRGGGL